MKGSALLLLLASPAAHADESDRLRDALRHVTIDLRAAQDSQATLQASLDQANKEKSQLQAQLDAANARAAAAPVAAPAKPVPDAALASLKGELAASRAQVSQLQAGLAQWQAAYRQAAGVAREKDEQGRTLAASGKAASGQLKTCIEENAKLTGVANDILHLYRSQGFRSVLVGSYEPLLGFDEVKLQNIVQDYEDRIQAQAYLPPAAPP